MDIGKRIECQCRRHEEKHRHDYASLYIQLSKHLHFYHLERKNKSSHISLLFFLKKYNPFTKQRDEVTSNQANCHVHVVWLRFFNAHVSNIEHVTSQVKLFLLICKEDPIPPLKDG